MSESNDEIVRRDFKHGKVAYGFQWNKSNHIRIGNETGDSASLWAHLTTIQSGKIPKTPFTDVFYSRASSLKFKKMSNPARTKLRRKLERAGNLRRTIEHDLIEKIRECHRVIGDNSYQADHSILSEMLTNDPYTIAIEVPVWSERYQLSGHVDLIRCVDGTIEVCDYKPGKMDSTSKRFFNSIPQVASYGEMVTHHLASTLRSALEASLLPKVRCYIFDTHAAWSFPSELFVTLETTGYIQDL